MTEEGLHDPRVLRAIAHPVRTRILGEMSAGGPMRAADLARELGVPANQASFHLRQLAKYGLVEEAPDEARDRRDRVWRVTAASAVTVRLSELERVPGGKAAVAVFRRSATSWAHHLVDRAFATDHEEGSGVFAVVDQTVRLTREEADQLRRELSDLVDGWVERTKGRDPERRTYAVLQVLQPYPDS